MARIVIEVIILCLFLWAAVSLSRRWSGLRRAQHQSPAIATAPTDALWRATHVGNEKNQTEVLVVLQIPGGTDVLGSTHLHGHRESRPRLRQAALQRDGGRQVPS